MYIHLLRPFRIPLCRDFYLCIRIANVFYLISTKKFDYFCVMELIYHYLWANMPRGTVVTLCDGSEMRVRSAGIHNRDAGPDFSHARLEIAGDTFVGNVEIHTAASDWYHHHHDSDPAYDSVILHAVGKDDRRILRTNGQEIPQLLIHIPESFSKTYSQLTSDLDGIRCREHIPSLSPLQLTDWLETLAHMRLQAKAERFIDTMQRVGNDWQYTLFITLARALGFGLNALPFECLAESIPLSFLHRHADDRFQLEALLFGQAGMLSRSDEIFEPDYQRLCSEYRFLARKYALTPMDRSMWKYARTRPQNFPHRRIAILAAAVEGGFALMQQLLDCKGDSSRLETLFTWTVSDYWTTHSSFGVSGTRLPSSLSRASIRLLLINFVAPFYMAYSRLQGIPEWGERAVSLLMSIPAESNSIIAAWRQCGVPTPDSLRTQALLHLRTEYCQRHRCADCRFGASMLRHSILSPHS